MIIPFEDLYDWQKEYILHEGNTTMKGGRQDGKSLSAGKRIKHLAEKYAKSNTLIIAASERQENYLLDKVKIELGKSYRYKGRATTTKLVLQNDSIIYKFPVGKTGVYVEGLSNIDFLFIDEAIHMNNRVYDSVIPMLAEPRKRGLGWINMLSATRGKPEGYFFDSFKDEKFLRVSVKSEDCPHISKEFLAEELKRLGPVMYGVIYNGDFSEEGYKYFSSEIIKRAATFKFWKMNQYIKELGYYLGIDPAGQGKSKAAFVVSELNKERVKVPYFETLLKSTMPELARKTESLHLIFDFRKIFIDPGGLGVGVVDILVDNKKLKRKIRPLNNAEAGSHGKILKEDLYSNTLRLFEQELIEIIDDPELIKALCDVEIDGEGKIKGTDLSEALVRACWCIKEKSLKCKMVTF